MHTAYGTGAMAWMRRRQHGSHPHKCQQCGKIDGTGLIATSAKPGFLRVCTRCLGKHIDAAPAR